VIVQVSADVGRLEMLAVRRTFATQAFAQTAPVAIAAAQEAHAAKVKCVPVVPCAAAAVEDCARSVVAQVKPVAQHLRVVAVAVVSTTFALLQDPRALKWEAPVQTAAAVLAAA